MLSEDQSMVFRNSNWDVSCSQFFDSFLCSTINTHTYTQAHVHTCAHTHRNHTVGTSAHFSFPLSFHLLLLMFPPKEINAPTQVIPLKQINSPHWRDTESMRENRILLDWKQTCCINAKNQHMVLIGFLKMIYQLWLSPQPACLSS